MQLRKMTMGEKGSEKMKPDGECPRSVPRANESQRHRDVVNQLLADGYSEGWFGDAVRAAICTACPAQLIPDAYRIDVEARTVTMCEVIVSNQIDKAKAWHIADLADQLDGADWKLRVVLYDSLGRGCDVDPFTLTPSMESLHQAVACLPRLPTPNPNPVDPPKTKREHGSFMWRGKMRKPRP